VNAGVRAAPHADPGTRLSLQEMPRRRAEKAPLQRRSAPVFILAARLPGVDVCASIVPPGPRLPASKELLRAVLPARCKGAAPMFSSSRSLEGDLRMRGWLRPELHLQPLVSSSAWYCFTWLASVDTRMRSKSSTDASRANADRESALSSGIVEGRARWNAPER